MLAAASAACSPTGKGTMIGHHDPFSQTLTPVHMQQFDTVPPVVSLPRPAVLPSTQGSSADSTDNARQSTEAAAKLVGESEADQESKKRKISYKIPRYVRRNLSRSEPADTRTTKS